MCGIVGLASTSPNPIFVERMNAAQLHRGPDDSGLWSDDGRVVLAMRRLAIVDIEEGHQPMLSPDGRFALIFNGEIFNAPFLRKQMEDEGHRFVSHHSDTEVLLQLYAKHGEKLLDHLDGMFAFVVYDRERHELFGARDPAGIKPLYLHHGKGTFAFASELKSLLTLPSIANDRAIDADALGQYLALQYVPSPRSIFKGVTRLPPGHQFRYRLNADEFSFSSYHRLPSVSQQPVSWPDLVLQTRRLLVESVEQWLMSDVPVGSSLSGGIDSAAIVGIMHHLGASPLRTYSLGFSDAHGEMDERPLARLVAERCNAQHHEIVVSPSEILNELGPMVAALDEPYGGGLPSWFVFRRMSQDVKVAMTGTGGDELFGSYNKWKAFCPMTRLWLSRTRWSLAHHGIAEVLKFPQGTRYPQCQGYLDVRRLLNEPFNVSASQVLQQRFAATNESDPRDALARVDFNLQLPDEFLHMTDRFSMAFSLEARTPFLARRLVEFAFSIPGIARLDRRRYKALLRESVLPFVPEEILGAKKRGFVLPINRWLKNELREVVDDVLSEAHLKRQGIFRAPAVAALVNAQRQGQVQASEQVWTLLMFQLWDAHFMGKA